MRMNFFRLLRWITAAFVLGYTLLFPNAPIRLSLLSIVFCVAGVLLLRDNRKHYCAGFATYAIYALFIGLVYTADGMGYEIGRAVKTPAVIGMLGLVTWVGVRALRPSHFLFYGLFWNAFQLLGIVLNMRGVDTHHILPFAVWKGIDLDGFRDVTIADQLDTQMRYYAFTAEGSIVASVSSIFAVFSLSYVFGKWVKSEKIGGVVLAITGSTVVSALLISVLAKTKAGLVVMLCYGAVAWISLLLGQADFRKKAACSIALGGIILVMITGVLGYAAYDKKAADYISQEAERTSTLLKKGDVSFQGGGTGTRVEYAKLAVLGFVYTPWGVGASNGYAYAKPVMDKIQPTWEMQRFFEQRIYNGYKSVFFNMMGMGGAVGVFIFFYLLNCLRKDTSRSWASGRVAIGWAVAVAFFAFGFCADEVPFFPLIAFAGAWCLADQEEAEINEATGIGLQRDV